VGTAGSEGLRPERAQMKRQQLIAWVATGVAALIVLAVAGLLVARNQAPAAPPPAKPSDADLNWISDRMRQIIKGKHAFKVRERAGWPVCSRAAARVMLPSSAMTRKARRCRNSTVMTCKHNHWWIGISQADLGSVASSP